MATKISSALINVTRSLIERFEQAALDAQEDDLEHRMIALAQEKLHRSPDHFLQEDRIKAGQVPVDHEQDEESLALQLLAEAAGGGGYFTASHDSIFIRNTGEPFPSYNGCISIRSLLICKKTPRAIEHFFTYKALAEEALTRVIELVPDTWWLPADGGQYGPEAVHMWTVGVARRALHARHPAVLERPDAMVWGPDRLGKKHIKRSQINFWGLLSPIVRTDANAVEFKYLAEGLIGAESYFMETSPFAASASTLRSIVESITEGSTSQKISTAHQAPDATGYVRNPADPSAYLPTQQIKNNYFDEVSGLSDKQLGEVVENYVENRIRWTRPLAKNGEPMKQRRNIHLIDWLNYIERCVTPPKADPSPEEIALQKARIRHGK